MRTGNGAAVSLLVRWFSFLSVLNLFPARVRRMNISQIRHPGFHVV